MKSHRNGFKVDMVSGIPVHKQTGAAGDCKDEEPCERTECHESKINQSIHIMG